MAVVSAGSLCAGPHELPTGVNRQYNVLEISPDFRSVRVHARAMTVANLFSRGHLPEFGGATFADLNWEPPKNPVGGTVNAEAIRVRRVIEEAETAAKTGNSARAIQLLRGIKLPEGSYERQLLLAAASESRDWQTIIQVTTKPHTIQELVQRVEAFIQIHKYADATNALDLFSKELKFPESMVAEFRSRIRAQEVMRR